jgi:hypothetical protein
MDTDTITEADLVENQFPWHEIDEMDALDEGFRVASCCNSIPCSNPMECPR